MSCLCSRLRRGQYNTINETETEILKRTWVEAPQLFQANSHASRRRRHPRKLSNVSSEIPISGDQPLQVISTLPISISVLVRSYSYKDAEKVFGESGPYIQQANGPSGAFVRLYLAIESSNWKIEIQQLFRRTCCYAFARLHKKGTSVDPIVEEIQNALQRDREATRTKVYHILRIGTKWIAIVEQFASIVKDHSAQQLTGLLCLLGSASTWERAATDDLRSALKYLRNSSDLYQQTLRFTPFVDRVLKQLHLEHSFVNETSKLTANSNTILTGPLGQPGRSSRNAAFVSRDLHTMSEPQPEWKSPSLIALCEAVPGWSHSEDAAILLIVLSFFSTSEKVPLDLLMRGATPRKRWTPAGEVEEVDALLVGLVPELCSLLSDHSRMAGAFEELISSTFIISDCREVYTLNEDIGRCVREKLPAEYRSFWEIQALIVTYRAIPWKYIEAPIPNIQLFLPHLKQTLQPLQNRIGILTASIRADVALTLIEASRFPNMAWKRFAIGQAELVAHNLEDPYLGACIAQSQSLLARIAGNLNQAVSSVGGLKKDKLSNARDKRMHSSMGQVTMQRSLNCVQVEDISTARKLLEDWNPLSQPSPMEEVVLFRKHMLLGRLLRFQGDFRESLAHLERARKNAEDCMVLIFDEDLRDLICDLADTLRELDDPETAERHLRAEIARRSHSCVCSPGQSLLELSLAEALFAQERLNEAEELCLHVQTRANLLKFETLRLHITRAKIHHVNLDDKGAFACWSEAMRAITKFPLTNGRSTRIIALSICDSLSRLGQTWLVEQTQEQAACLDQLAKPGGTQYWIAGMRHWLEYLQNRGRLGRL